MKTKANVSENLKEDVWKKLIINCVLNPTSAILKVDNNGISDEKLNPLKNSIVDECLKVAKKEGVKINIEVDIINNAIRGSKNLSSMNQDIIKGKKTEIDYLNGTVVELGKKHGIKCPVNEGLVSMIKFLENKN